LLIGDRADIGRILGWLDWGRVIEFIFNLGFDEEECLLRRYFAFSGLEF